MLFSFCFIVPLLTLLRLSPGDGFRSPVPRYHRHGTTHNHSQKNFGLSLSPKKNSDRSDEISRPTVKKWIDKKKSFLKYKLSGLNTDALTDKEFLELMGENFDYHVIGPFRDFPFGENIHSQMNRLFEILRDDAEVDNAAAQPASKRRTFMEVLESTNKVDAVWSSFLPMFALILACVVHTTPEANYDTLVAAAIPWYIATLTTDCANFYLRRANSLDAEDRPLFLVGTFLLVLLFELPKRTLLHGVSTIDAYEVVMVSFIYLWFFEQALV